MGAWSANIFDDDTAMDIIGEYKILLGYGIPPEEVYKKISDYFSEYREEDADVYWLSIALYQWKNGILMDEVKQKALECIDNESYLERWKDSREKIYKKRKQVLEELRYNLINIVNPPKKKFPKCSKCYRCKTEWKVGDLLAYKMTQPMIQWGELVGAEKKRKIFRGTKKDKRGVFIVTSY